MKRVLFLALVPLLAACTTPENQVSFVTSTEIGVGVDPAIGTAHVGYGRNELIITPSYPEHGAVPDLYADLKSNRTLSQPRILQTYATGKAARIATDTSNTSSETASNTPGTLEGKRKTLIFGTSTNLGLKASAVNATAPSFQLGYKRKEFSRIPLLKKEERDGRKESVPSVFAHLEVDLRNSDENGQQTATPVGLDFRAGQLMATGVAAENVAEGTKVKEGVEATVARAVEKSCEETGLKATNLNCPASE